jgi:hypothetical protein
MNLKRRHLDATQRSAIAAELANIKLGDFVGNQHVGSANWQTPVSQTEAATLLNVSPRSVAAELANMPLGGAMYRSANWQTDIAPVSQTEAATQRSAVAAEFPVSLFPRIRFDNALMASR